MPEKRRKEIIHRLATPTKDMFDVLEKSCVRILHAHYTTFSNTKEFQSLPTAIMTMKKEAASKLKNKLKIKKSPSVDQEGGWFGVKWFLSSRVIASTSSDNLSNEANKYTLM